MKIMKNNKHFQLYIKTLILVFLGTHFVGHLCGTRISAIELNQEFLVSRLVFSTTFMTGKWETRSNPESLTGPQRVSLSQRNKEIDFGAAAEAEQIKKDRGPSTDHIVSLDIDDCCIYRVPEQLRELNEKAYTPRLVSIGPLHYTNQKLKAMEQVKRKYLQDFLERSGATLDQLITGAMNFEERLRNCYAEPIQLNRKEFVEMMLMDAAFIIEYLLKRHFQDWSLTDRIFNKQRMTNSVRFDLLLLENQLPFFFLKYLLEIETLMIRRPSFNELVGGLITGSLDWECLLTDNITGKEVHFVDVIRNCLRPSRNCLPQEKIIVKTVTSPTIKELHEAGVRFRSSSSKCLLDIKFRKGILEIPKWRIYDYAEIVFRNIQAFEQCHFCDHCYLSDYIAIMDFLINLPEDVELLVQTRIIENFLQDNQAVADLVNNLGKENLISDNFYFSGLIEDLNKYCQTPWHRWKANLRQQYFNNPWAIISVIAAAFLLILTVIQTVCSILQVV